jgi:hypothetical protein
LVYYSARRFDALKKLNLGLFGHQSITLKKLTSELNVPKSVLWTGSAFGFGRLDPDPGGQKLPTKVKKIQVLKYWNFSFQSFEG